MKKIGVYCILLVLFLLGINLVISYDEEKFDKKIDKNMMKIFENQSEISVIIILNKNNNYFNEYSDINTEKISNFEKEKLKIKNQQDRVLATLNKNETLLNKIYNKNKSLQIKNKNFKLKRKYNIISALSGNVTKGDIENLIQNSDVRYIQLDRKKSFVLDESVPLVNATNTWKIVVNNSNITGKGETVCIIDSGIDYTHPAFGSCTKNEFLAGNCSKVIAGYDFKNDDNNPIDDQGHGTHVAGIIASEDQIYRGVAPDANVVAIKVCDNTAGGNCEESDIIAGIDWCVNNAAKYNISVISISLGGTLYSSYCDDIASELALKIAIDSSTARNISVIAAAGNSGSTTHILSPACLKNVTAVGSTTKSDKISSFSNRNNITDLLAPGSSITSTVPKGSCILCNPSGFIVVSGTSMATPHVSGAFMLVKQFFKLNQNKILKPIEIKDMLKESGVKIQDVSGNNLIYSRINIFNTFNITKLPICGNNEIDENEICDGSNLNGTTCQNFGYSNQNFLTCNFNCLSFNTSTCINTCGDGFQEPGEECDQGAQNSVTCSAPYNGTCSFCSLICKEENLTGSFCGDGSLENQFEECDDGNNIKGDGCDQNCIIEICGDGIIQPPEECDDGQLNGILCIANYGSSCSYCSNQCTFNILNGRFCGDSILDPQFEECDDGNNINGDGCSSICEQEFSPIVYSPFQTIVNARRIPFNLTTNLIVDEISYIDYADSNPRERRLCRNCDEYGNSRKKTKSFRDGKHNLSFIASLNGKNKEENFSFFIDSKKPRISKTKPRRGFASGNFYVEFIEDNPKNLTLFYGNPILTKEFNISKCSIIRNRQACSEFINLSQFDGTNIQYWFSLDDIANNVDISRFRVFTVDQLPPVIKDFNFIIDRRRVTFNISINETNFDSVKYIDNEDRRPRWRTLCSRLRNDICLKKKSFRTGFHNLTINVTDDAKNYYVLENVTFNI